MHLLGKPRGLQVRLSADRRRIQDLLYFFFNDIELFAFFGAVLSVPISMTIRSHE